MKQPSRPCLQPLALIASLVLATVGASPGRAQVYTFETVAFTGDLADQAGGATYEGFSDLEVNAGGWVLYEATLSGGPSSRGFFLHADGSSAKVVLEGDPSPAPGSGDIVVLREFDLSDAGNVVLSAADSNGSGVFFESNGSLSRLAADGNPAPDGAGGTSGELLLAGVGLVGIDESDSVVFQSGIFAGSSSAGIFRWTTTSSSAVARRFDVAPGTGGGTYDAFLRGPRTNGVGDVVFQSAVAGSASTTSGLFLDSGGSQTSVVLEGDPAPSPLSGTIDSITGTERLHYRIGASGAVALHATLSTGTSGLFLYDGGTATIVALEGDPAPGTSGSINGFLDLSLADTGEIAFVATTTDLKTGVFLAKPMGTILPIAVSGDPAPHGGTWDGFSRVRASATGAVAFTATGLSLGIDEGVFLARLVPEVPSAGPTVLTVALVLLGATGAWLARVAHGRSA